VSEFVVPYDLIRMRDRLRIAAAAILGIGVVVGVALILMRGPVLTSAVDCLPPPGYVSGGYRCYVTGHPHGLLGALVILVSVGVFAVLWLLSYRRSEARIWSESN
jgi:hypothetical protein